VLRRRWGVAARWGAKGDLHLLASRRYRWRRTAVRQARVLNASKELRPPLTDYVVCLVCPICLTLIAMSVSPNDRLIVHKGESDT